MLGTWGEHSDGRMGGVFRRMASAPRDLRFQGHTAHVTTGGTTTQFSPGSDCSSAAAPSASHRRRSGRRRGGHREAGRGSLSGPHSRWLAFLRRHSRVHSAGRRRRRRGPAGELSRTPMPTRSRVADGVLVSDTAAGNRLLGGRAAADREIVFERTSGPPVGRRATRVLSQTVMKRRRRTETGEAPRRQGATTVGSPHFFHTDSARLPQVARSRRYEESGIRPPHPRRRDRRVLLLPVRTAAPEPVVTTQPFSRGDIVDAVSATGTLEAVETVEVGTQVSGVVRELNADFNSIVRKGQVIARLDPQLIQTQIEQQSANVLRAEADLDRLKVSQADAEQKLERRRAAERAQPDPAHGARDGGGQRRVGKGAGQGRGSQPHPGARPAAQPARQPRLHDDYRAHRRHRHLAQRRRRPDGRGQHERADAVRARRGPDADAGRGEHRRVRRGTHAARAVRQLPGRRLPQRAIHGHRVAGAPAADGRAERGDLLDGHHRAKPRR